MYTQGEGGEQQQPGLGQEDQHPSGFSFHEQEDDSRWRQEGAAATSGYISACITSFIIRTSFDIEIIAFI